MVFLKLLLCILAELAKQQGIKEAQLQLEEYSKIK